MDFLATGEAHPCILTYPRLNRENLWQLRIVSSGELNFCIGDIQPRDGRKGKKEEEESNAMYFHIQSLHQSSCQMTSGGCAERKESKHHGKHLKIHWSQDAMINTTINNSKEPLSKSMCLNKSVENKNIYLQCGILTWRTRTGPTRKLTPSEVKSRCRHGSSLPTMSVQGNAEVISVSFM